MKFREEFFGGNSVIQLPSSSLLFVRWNLRSLPSFQKEESLQEQRKLSHRQKDSKNYEKQRKVVARLHAKIKHQRKDRLHKLSEQLTREYDLISIENLDMSASKQTLNLGKSYSDNGWGMFVTMLLYKGKRNGCYIIKIDKWFPSSKTCSQCGYVHKDLQLSDRTYVCPVCGNLIGRDEQAAINIDLEGLWVLLSA